jgi:tetratricopeptide (TPR) repeat protein
MENGLVVQTMLRIGNVLLCKGEASSALECFGEVLGIGYASDSVNAIEVANALYGRGCAQFCGFQLSDAMKSFSESLNWKLAALGENDSGLACIFYQMAHVHLEQSDTEEAITYFEEYARLLKLDPQRNLHDNAEICFTEGIIAKMKENFEAALSLYKTALVMFDTLFGGGIHEKIASIHFEIGYVMSELENSNEVSLRHFKECLLQRKQLLGSHVDVANVLLEMASIYTKENDFESAEKCLEESDRIWKSKLGNNSEKLTSVLMISGKRWKAIHCYQEAEANFEQALEIAITIHGQKHELVADILLDLGELLQEISQTQQAFFCFNESIEIRSTLFGVDSPSVAKAEYSKGVAHIFQGQFEEAANCLNRALIIRQEKLGPMDSAVGDTLNTIGFLQLKMGNIGGRDALDPLMEALEIRRSVGNKGKVVSTLQNILSLYKKRKDYDSCIEVNADILAVRLDDFGPTHERVAEAWLNLGTVQASAGKFFDARESYEEALRVRTANFGYHHRLVAQVLFKLGSLNSRENNFDDAKQLFAEYIRIRAEEESDPDEEMAQALTLMGDLQKESGEKSKAQINWMSAIEIYQQLGYEDDHKKVMRLHSRQKSLGMVGLFGGFGRRESEASRRKSSGSLADNLSVLCLKFGGDDNASTISKLTMQL